MQSSWSVLTVILHISKELQSSSRVQSHSVLTISWTCPHTAWWLLPNHSDQRLPLHKLQEAPYPLPVLLASGPNSNLICVWTCDVVPGDWLHVRVSHICSRHVWVGSFALLSLSWSPMLLEVPITMPLWGSAVALVGLEGELEGSCSCGSELGPASGTNLGMFSLPCVELHLPLALTSWESTQVCLLHQSPRVPLGEWSCFFHEELALNPKNRYPTGGVPTKGISRKGGTRRGGVPVWWARLSEGSRSCEPSGSGIAIVTGPSTSCSVVVASASLM